MQKQGMKEIKLEIRNEFVMNLMNYFMTQEGYLFVGNEKEVYQCEFSRFLNFNWPKTY